MPRYTVERPRDFGAVLAARREETGVSQEVLADQLGFARSYLSELEAGKATLQLGRLFRALHALGVEVEVSWTDPAHTEDDRHG